MSTSVQNIFALFVRIWPRIIGFSDTPSLLVVALIANLVAVIPVSLRIPRESVACQARAPACAESQPDAAGPPPISG